MAPAAGVGGARRDKHVTSDLPTGRRPNGPASAPGEPAEDPAALFRCAVNAELAWGGRGPGCGPDCVTGCEGTGQSAMFRAVPGQVRAVRDFVRLALAVHPAAEDAVAVASELAANTVAHSGSGHTGGMFTVHVNTIGQAAGLTVTELRGAGYPQVQNVGTGTAAGRGLVIVQALTSLFWVSDGPEIRILFATIPARPARSSE